MKKTLLILAGLLFFARSSFADFVRVPYEGIRPLGMGNAFIALADDKNALWYNPAGLANVRGVHFNVFDFAGGVDSSDTMTRAYNALFKGDYSNLLRPDQENLRFNVQPTFVAPYFGLMIFNNMQGLFSLQNLTLPNVDVYAMNDTGVLLAAAFPASEYLSFGASARAFVRGGIDTTLTPQQLISQLGLSALSDFNNAVYQYLQTLVGQGYGIGLNVGTLVKIPLGSKTSVLKFAATVEDVGNTKINPLGSGTNTPAPIPMAYNFGAALTNTLSAKSVLNIAVDYRNAFSSQPLFEQLHVGAEYRHKFFGLRAGYYQGYPTFGVSLETPPHTRIHFASYVVEQGGALWANGIRLYTAQIEIGFNPF